MDGVEKVLCVVLVLVACTIGVLFGMTIARPKVLDTVDRSVTRIEWCGRAWVPVEETPQK